MTREEAAREIDNTACCFSDKRFRDAMHMAAAALRGPQPDPKTELKGCWHCRNIEAHHIEYVIAVKAKGGRPMNMPVDCPYHYCPACGRKLGVEG
jgi:hypothetical protein